MLFRRPLREVAGWPAVEIDLLEHYLARQPAPEDRIEIAVATLCSLFVNANRAAGSPAMNPTDFLPYLNPFVTAQADRYSDVDRSIMAGLGVRLK